MCVPAAAGFDSVHSLQHSIEVQINGLQHWNEHIINVTHKRVHRMVICT